MSTFQLGFGIMMSRGAHALKSPRFRRGFDVFTFVRKETLFLDSFLVLAAEALHATGGVNQLLFAGEKRVAVGADFQADFAFMGGPCGENVAACAMHAHFVVSGMDTWLHGRVEPFRLVKSFILA
jgi:hypothetical protein